jgi:hypothetical protein
MSDASLLLEETYQKKENEQHNQTYILEEQLLRLVPHRLTDLLGKVSYTFAEKVAQSKTPSPESADGGY